MNEHEEGFDGYEEELREAGARIANRLDPRLADVWVELFASELGRETLEQVAWFVRMAYVIGFKDGAQGRGLEELYGLLGVPQSAGGEG